MLAEGLTAILNVSNMDESFTWFAKLGWKKLWDWGTPSSFGAVGSGKCEIFLCLNGQGGRGRSELASSFGDGETGNSGVWLSIWVEDVDAVYKECLANDVEVVRPPTDFPWNVREMHIRHPDGHVFRVGRGSQEEN